MVDYDVGKAFEEIENELISSMIRNLKRHKAEEIAEGMNWSQWQVEQLKSLDEYKRRNAQKYGTRFSSINEKIEEMLTDSYNDGATKQEQDILKSIKKGFTADNSAVAFDGNTTLTGEFFKTNDRKLNSLIKATTDDMKRAETAVLRMTNDKYRKVIFNAQVYANSGAGTYKKAVDMATKDFLSAGINCIEYKNGRRVNIKSYAEMAIRTANKRAYLQGEGEMRKKWGIHTVILNKRSNACPKCLPYVGKVIVDDVWSGGTETEAREKGYLLMSECIEKGLYHPNCKDSHSTYFGDILDEEDGEQPAQSLAKPEPITPKEQKQCEDLYNAEQYQQYAERQAEKWDRMSEFSLDKDNKRMYRARQNEWKTKNSKLKEYVHKLKNRVVNSENNSIIKLTDKLATIREKLMPATDKTFEEVLGISKANSERLNDIHKSLNDFMKKNNKEKLVALQLDSGLENSRVGTQSEVEFDKDLIKFLKNSPRDTIILSHVHPGITPFSKDDIEKILTYKSIKALTLECADGSKYIIKKGKRKLGITHLFDIPMLTMENIYEQTALEKFPGVNFEKKWGEVGYQFVTESASRICDHYNLIFERLT